MAMTETQIFQSAIENLHKYGWWQGRGVGPNGERCLIGALPLQYTAIYIDEWYTAIQKLEGAVGRLIRWNDNPARTKEDVILLLKYAEADELATWKELYGEGLQ